MNGISITLLVLILLSYPATRHAFANDICDDYKSKADHFNDFMREHRVTESYKRQHRKWMDKYYACTTNRDNRSSAIKPQQPRSALNSTIRQIPTSNKQQKSNTPRISTSSTTNSYHNFKGAKLIAWAGFFQESSRCNNNKGNMAIFVECSAERKDYLERFNRLWDEENQSLKSPLIN